MNLKGIDGKGFKILNNCEHDFDGFYLCDLLSMALVKAKSNYAFVTVINNANSVAVCVEKKMNTVFLVDGVKALDEMFCSAVANHITLIETEMSAYEVVRFFEEQRC